MERKEDILKKKYFKVHNVTDLKDMLYKSAKMFKNNDAFRLKDKDGKIYGIKFIEFKNDVEALGTSLIDLKLSNKSIAVIGKNSYSWITSYLASTIVGTAVPIDKELFVDDIINFLNISETKAVIGDEKHIKLILENKDKLNDSNIILVNIDNRDINKDVIKLDELIKKGSKKVENGDTSFSDIQINPDDMHVLLFTSGTTGNAKGICLNIMSVAKIVRVDKRTLVLSILPIHHTYECTLGHLLQIYGGGVITYCDGLRYISKNMLEYKPTSVVCVPLLLENIHKKIINTLKKSLPEKYFNNDKHFLDNMPLIVGAAAINPDIIESFYKIGIKALQGYGLTECSPLVAGNNDIFYKADSVGLPIPDVEFKINNPDSEGNGEIIVKGPNVMLGYYNDPESTDRVFKKGWFYTGDLGRIDEDGFLYLTGRCKSVIVTQNGKNIYPEEIEYYLNENPLIEECIVVGAKHENDPETYVTAKVLPNKEAFKEFLEKEKVSDSEINKEIKKVISDINKKLPNYKHIKDFKIVDEPLEKTTTKKIKRFGNNLSM